MTDGLGTETDPEGGDAIDTRSDASPTGTDSDAIVGGRGREVVVPMELYKIVTVFSTLLAVVAVVIGFVLLDWGTDRAQAAPGDVNILLVIAGLTAIALGALTYAFSTRFRTRGMGTSKEDADGASDDG